MATETTITWPNKIMTEHSNELVHTGDCGEGMRPCHLLPGGGFCVAGLLTLAAEHSKALDERLHLLEPSKSVRMCHSSHGKWWRCAKECADRTRTKIRNNTDRTVPPLQMRSKGYHSPALPPHRLPSQQSVLALNPVVFEIAWNFAQLSVPQTSPDAQPTLSHGSQSGQQSIAHGVTVRD